MDSLVTLLSETPLAEWMRLSRWGYAGINTLHVLGIALLVGAILPLDLRLMGRRPELPLVDAARLLQPVAVLGLVLALATGALLFLAAPGDYLAMPLFLAKLTLIAVAVGNALWLNLGPGLARATRHRRWLAGGASLLLWLAVLICGRLLAFVAE
ncbi:hypothetical protein [Halomonas maura]|uniref:hypothetical protein n=1 Tax=Halomonas maura TaxID=117606 RepID=UPI0025B29587|nr:hypothetical protein [Halomonas maura]MDN3555713.1 hypothetical protein [Halomonas maura]